MPEAAELGMEKVFGKQKSHELATTLGEGWLRAEGLLHSILPQDNGPERFPWPKLSGPGPVFFPVFHAFSGERGIKSQISTRGPGWMSLGATCSSGRSLCPWKGFGMR